MCHQKPLTQPRLVRPQCQRSIDPVVPSLAAIVLSPVSFHLHTVFFVSCINWLSIPQVSMIHQSTVFLFIDTLNNENGQFRVPQMLPIRYGGASATCSSELSLNPKSTTSEETSRALASLSGGSLEIELIRRGKDFPQIHIGISYLHLGSW